MSAHARHPRPTRVALIEDDEILATLLEYNLVAAGYGVRHLSNGGDALRLIDEWRPDLVILDWTLPSLAGIEVLRRLRHTEPNRLLPVIILTARTDPDDRSTALAVGADSFFCKPFSLQELMTTIRGLLRPALRIA